MPDFAMPNFGTRLEYNEADHTYWLDGRQLPSVTQILHRQGISPDLGSVPEGLLREKAEHGTYVHEEIQNFIERGEMGISDEFQDFLKLVYPLAETWLCEVMVNTDDYAGRLDLLGIRDDRYILVDTKTGNVDRNSVSWQTSMYAYAFPKETRGLVDFYCFDAKMDGQSKLVQLERVSDECIKALVEADKKGEKYDPMLPVVSKTEHDLMALEAVITDLEAQLKKAKAEKEKFSNMLLKAMEDGRVMSFDSPSLHISYVDAYDSVLVDGERLKAKYPEVYADCQKVSHRKASLRIKVKGA